MHALVFGSRCPRAAIVLEPDAMTLDSGFRCLDSRWLSSLRDVAIVLFLAIAPYTFLRE